MIKAGRNSKQTSPGGAYGWETCTSVMINSTLVVIGWKSASARLVAVLAFAPKKPLVLK